MSNEIEQRSSEECDMQDAARYRRLKQRVDTIYFTREVCLTKNGKPIYVSMIGARELDEALDNAETQ